MNWMILAGFALFLLNDWNDFRAAHKSLQFLFPAGFLLVVMGTGIACILGGAAYPPALRIPAAFGAVFSLLLMLYSLFGAIPLGASYAEAGAKRPACTVGIYAMCRHPGVFWFILLYLCLHFTFGMDPMAAILACLLNVLLAAFEDAVVFPHLLTGYADYKKTTPFLIPTVSSVRRCCSYYRSR